MSSEIDLAATAYQQISEFYCTSVDVTTFTWNSFAARNATLLTASGFIIFYRNKYYYIAILLLLIGSMFTFSTAHQMANNQKVIQRTLAAGVLLEYKNPKLGFLYQQSVSENMRKYIGETYRKKERVVVDMDLIHFGITPNIELVCRMYAGAYFIFAFLILVVGLRKGFPGV